jgi:hypothetical protein
MTVKLITDESERIFEEKLVLLYVKDDINVRESFIIVINDIFYNY